MNKPLWVIFGATSIIAKEFAHIAAAEGHALLLAGRNQNQLDIIAADLRLRYAITCDTACVDFGKDIGELTHLIENTKSALNLFIAHSCMLENDQLNSTRITDLIDINILSTVQLIHTYWSKPQSEHRLLFLSSVAAVRGRCKNSLYGATKAAIEIYLQGLQQAANGQQFISIARLGFIDTHQTFGKPGIFYASPPAACARACWRAMQAKKRLIYHPSFWRFIMAIIANLPFFVYKRLGKL